MSRTTDLTGNTDLTTYTNPAIGLEATSGAVSITGATGFSFHGTTQTGIAVSAAGIHAALVALGLITA